MDTSSIKKLSIAEQIQFLKNAKDYYTNTYHCYGMCKALRLQIEEIPFVNTTGKEDTQMLRKMLPIFSYKTLYQAGKNGLIPKLIYFKTEVRSHFWWDTDDKQARIQAFDWMISELEKQLK